MSSQFIEKYEVLETLGKGSMGVVYKARDPEIGRLVAIKTLKAVFLSEDAVGQEALQRFRQESRSAGRLHHPNIVTIFEAGRAQNGSPYIVMEYIEGTSLESVVRERGVVEPLEAFHYLAQIANAIDYALGQNIIHRDIKPSNIIIDLHHRPFLLDFGVAKLSDTSLTPAGTVVGTPSYMSPEQIRGEPLDGRSDLFSFAVVTYEVLTGKRPFPGNDFTTVVSNILQKPPLPFAEVGCSLPKYLEGVLAQGLAREREQRFSTASAFIDAAAQTLGISVDNTGLIGGFRPGMKLSPIAASEVGGRTRAPTVYHGMSSGAAGQAAGQPSGQSGSHGAVSGSGSFGAARTPAGQPSAGGPGTASHAEGAPNAGGRSTTGGDSGSHRAQAAPLDSAERITTLKQDVLQQGAGSLPEDAETRLIAPGEDYFAKLAESSKQAASANVGLGAKGPGDAKGESRPLAGKKVDSPSRGDAQKSRAPLILAAVVVVGVLGAGGWYVLENRGMLHRPGAKGDAAGNPDERPEGGQSSGQRPPANLGSGEKSPEGSSGESRGGESGAVIGSVAPGSKTPPGESSGVQPTSIPTVNDSVNLRPELMPVKPSIPASGLTAADIHLLKNEELAWLLSEQQDAKLLQLVIAEIGARENTDLFLRLMPVSMHQDYAVRINVIKALSRSNLRTNPEVLAIITAALSDSEFLVRGFAAKTLAAIGGPESKRALEQQEKEEKNQVVLKVIQESLASLRKDEPAGASK